MTASGRLRALSNHPARFVVASFVVAIAVGTALLALPAATRAPGGLGLGDALFTATSAVCVTGLSVVDPGTQLTGFGQLVLAVLAQLGGLGFMTMASLIALLLARRLGLWMSLIATTERSTLELGDVRRVLRGVALVTVTVETVVAVVLTARLRTRYDYGIAEAVWHGVFHSIMAFNNAGFSLYPDSLNRFATDVVVTAPVMAAIVIGGLGFPVLVDLVVRGRTRHSLSLHSKLTLWATAGMLVIGLVMILAAEWSNPETLGGQSPAAKGWLGLFASVSPRTAGFHTITPAAMTEEGLLGTTFLMFIGAGSAGTSGGIKVGTFVLLGLVILAELRGSRDVVAFGRRIPETVQRQALAVALLSVGVVALATMSLLALTGLHLRDVSFEAVSAFGTVGLSTGITPLLPAPGKLLLVGVMLIGRVGPVTLFTALVLRYRPSVIREPQEAPLIG
ncbi:MAG: TrkH family potassium uptake protein [Acidimicrobiales bacterium]|nr:TrkH family potassium uptake protein [Acidimicrobiales bacterium]